MGKFISTREKWEFIDEDLNDNPRKFVEALRKGIQSDESQLIYRLRNKIYRLRLDEFLVNEIDDYCIKSFAPPKKLRSWHYQRIGSKAERSFRYSKHLQAHGVAVPKPVGFYEVWEGNRLRESYFITEYVDSNIDLYSEMNRLLREDPDVHKYISLLDRVAKDIRRMHDCGFQHNDLGGQNVMLDKVPAGERGACRFIDLNRGRIHPKLTMRQRARDLAKLEIPSFLRRIFFHKYFHEQELPELFVRWENRYRLRITFHNESRKYRHPIRTLRERKNSILLNDIRPSYRDTWLWDSLTGQPSIIHDRKERKQFASRLCILKLIVINPGLILPVLKKTRELLRNRYLKPVSMNNRMGMSLDLDTNDLPLQLDFIDQTPNIPLFVRVYHHKGSSGLNDVRTLIATLHKKGHEITLGLIQWRQSITQPDKWAAFVENALEQLHPYIVAVEVGHAINRVKWGTWNLKESASLWKPITAELKQTYSKIRFLGPAVNDFEYHYYAPLLRQISPKPDALSCHLYVDRRGAPESKQGGFSLIEKCALAKAIGNYYHIEDFYITETNWPLANSDIYSPITCPYIFPGEGDRPIHVSENTYAMYMVRFYLISLCSGFVEKVFWWRISSRGFGLIDPAKPKPERPAYLAFVFLIQSLQDAVFQTYTESDDHVAFVFNKVSIYYSRSASPPPLQFDSSHQIYDFTGSRINESQITLSESPIYVFNSTSNFH